MSAHDKNGLGYDTQLNEMSDKSETDSEINMSVFEVRFSDEELTPANDKFSKADGYQLFSWVFFLATKDETAEILWDYVPLMPAMLAGAAEDQGKGSAIPGPTFTHVADEATTTGVRVGTEGDTTINFGLDAELDSGIDLKKELHQTKTTYGKAVLTLVERVKSLDVSLKRKTKKVVVSDSDDEEIENQGRKLQDIDDDPLVSLVREFMKEKDTDFVTPTKISASGESTNKGIRYKRKTRSNSIKKDISTDLDVDIEVNPGSKDFNTGNEDFNTGSLRVSIGSGPVSTPSVVQTINVIIPSPIKSQREGKAPMTTEEIQTTKRTKAQIQQEEDGLAEAMRLQALQEEEAARQVHLDALIDKRILEEEELSEQQKKRKAEVQEAAQFYTEED
ncbi:hypothetical protein Tco_1133028 [Tanacetum coccineum]|uniref:Uncharacterized protein n=1 Tax=Tanacetum coccineum TaxID=301880 RepID=A0ABQ5JDJ1_9ASTR